MPTFPRALRIPWVAVALPALLFTGCVGGSSGSSGSDDLQVENISVTQGAPWKINRPIDVAFNKEIDIGTVSLNTINIQNQSGTAATGTFSYAPRADGTLARNVIRFQPTCPKRADNSDAGLRPGTTYTLLVLGAGTGGVTVQSTGGETVTLSRSVTFTTPVGNSQALFLDTVPGPPQPVVRGLAGVAVDELNATYLELGGNPLDRVYFALNFATQRGELPAGYEVPQNLYSVTDSQVSVVVFFNQPVQGTPGNLNSQRLRLEYNPSGGLDDWLPIATEVELLENCTEAGSAVRLTPVGLLPQDSALRVNVRQGFADITGSATSVDQINFARGATGVVNHPGTSDPSKGADEVLEPFVLTAPSPDSLEDEGAALEAPPADWGGGTLKAAFDFSGTGGPGGNFDWYITAGSTVVLNTTLTTIQGGPGGSPVTSQSVINGVVDVRNLWVQSGARLVIVGPKVCTILASGWVQVDGELSVNGSNNPGVTTLGTTNLPEPGASGNGGGGRGGTASFLTSQSTPAGGNGFGAFNVPNGGGRGGETGYATPVKDDRRGAGGGGGRLGPDVYYEYVDGDTFVLRAQGLIGLDAEPGFGGGAGTGRGAISQINRAMGGAMGPFPFLDDDPENDFFGSMLVDPGTDSQRLVIGELDRLWAGAGGGGGGDAVDSDTFPLTPFSINGDEKGAGGGGGAGGLQILAIDRIEVGPNGRIAADGGFGGGGENTNFFDRVGGGSGGGSGGHIVLSSANQIIVDAIALNAEPWYTEPVSVLHFDRPLSALGGQGGAGNDNKGGAKETGETFWRCDAIPLEYLETTPGNYAPPSGNNCFENQRDLADPLGPSLGAGGDGSPGLIQLHVDDPPTNLLFPATVADGDFGTTLGVDLDVTAAMAPPMLGWTRPDAPVNYMVPFFGRASAGQSKWIALGLAKVGAAGAENQVELAFDGIDTGTGEVLRLSNNVQQLPPILGPDPLGNAATQATPFITDGGTTMVFDASTLVGDDEIYKRNAALVRNFTIKLFEPGNEATNFKLFSIVSASYDPATDRLTAVTAGGLNTFNPAGGVNVTLVPHFFRMVTNDVVDSYPPGTEVRVLFDATRANAEGDPSENPATLHGFTSDISELNAESWDFFRFRVEFDLGSGVSQSTPRPALQFLRVPFEY